MLCKLCYDHQDVLKGVTFSVEPRMKVAVVGTLTASRTFVEAPGLLGHP